MAATLTSPRLHDAADDHQPQVGSTVWAVVHPIGPVPDGPDDRWVLVMGEVMGVRHRTLAVEGVQFHPEAILTEHGKQMLGNFLEGRR